MAEPVKKQAGQGEAAGEGRRRDRWRDRWHDGEMTAGDLAGDTARITPPIECGGCRVPPGECAFTQAEQGPARNLLIKGPFDR